MPNDFYFSLIIYFIISLFLTFVVRKFAIKNGHFDKPNSKNMHKQSTPIGAGIAIILIFFFYLLLTDIKSDQILNNFFRHLQLTRIWVLYSIIIISMFFFYIDDRISLNPLLKLLFQFIAAYCLLANINFPIFNLPTKIEYLITIFIIIYFLNIFNFIDGLDGMFSLTTYFILISVNILIFNDENYKFLFLTNIIFMTIFLTYAYLNLSKKYKIFLGDCGTIPIGIYLTWQMILLINSNYKTSIILIYFYPALDVSLTLLKKLCKGRNIFSRDFDYYFLKLVKNAKFSHMQSFLEFFKFYTINMILILFFYYTQNYIFFVISILLSIWVIFRLEKGLKFFPIFRK
jgi:UDP-GlcNAc:undecaprenyl-phosphate GlcNAc-1-phosphate transferase